MGFGLFRNLEDFMGAAVKFFWVPVYGEYGNQVANIL